MHEFDAMWMKKYFTERYCNYLVQKTTAVKYVTFEDMLKNQSFDVAVLM